MPKKKESPQVYEVINEFRARCLEKSGSLLWDHSNVWTIENLGLIEKHFIDMPDTTADDFWSKSKRQLAGLPQECFMIFSDALMVYLLPSLSINRETKLSFLDRVHEIGGPEPPKLNSRVNLALGQGLAHTGIRYNVRYMQVWLLIRFALKVKERMSTSDMADPWVTAKFLDECLYSFKPRDRAYDMRHALLHMFFPDVFERVLSTEHKIQIARAFLSPSEIESVKRMDSSDDLQSLISLDQLLTKVRQQLGPNVDFYSPEIKKRWEWPHDNSDGMSEPFSTLFVDRDEAVWAFELMKRVIIGLGLGSADDPRLVLSLAFSHGSKAIHLDFCNWLILGFNAPSYEPQRFEILMLESTAASLIGREPCYSFKQTEGEPKLNCYTVSSEEARNLGEQLLRGVEEALPALLKRFSTYKFSPYKKFHVKALQQAAMDSTYCDKLLSEGLTEQEIPGLDNTDNQFEGVRGGEGAVASDEEIQPNNPEYSLTQMSEETYFTKDELEKWVRAIERKGQAIFYGPPGTGKTFIAMKLTKHLIGGGNGFTEAVQFHPAYSYEDFIQGIRVKTSDDGRLIYPMEPGRFLQFCSKAQSRAGRCVLVIDEINRANLSRVFGELMYLLEYRDGEVPLAGDGRLFSIPKNVRIIGTMNTADRSIALVDHAFRRRFAFISLRPNFEVLRKYHARTGFPVENLINVLSKLNMRISDPNFEVGISFFMRENLAQELSDIWEMEIEPYLEEYFFDQPGVVKELRWAKVKGEILP